MFVIKENGQWPEEVHGWETEDPVEGGPGGCDNIPIEELACRTQSLKAKSDAMQADQTLQWQAINLLSANINNLTNEITENPFLVLLNDEAGWEMISGVYNAALGRLEC
jgi:hypothetical protein